MKNIIRVCLLLLAPAATAQPLRVVNVSAPAIQCLFSPSCKVTVEDLSAPVAARGFLQSRHYKTSSGLYVYEYRVDLRDAAGANGIHTLTVEFGPNTRLDFDGKGKAGDVFVTTHGNLGSVGLESAVRDGNRVTFTFRPAVAGGDSTFFFGLVSRYPRRTVAASAAGDGGPPLTLEAWAPHY
ncbi:MAG TPA: hypothetical protein VG323_09375 [Thermoanaerobaculia bacterium]|nr:hypothetical protein [Thermoanaerobaculia bacterium]